VFEATVSGRKNSKGAWFGLNMRIPEAEGWVSKEEYEVFKKLHTELAENHRQGLLQVDYEDLPTDHTEGASTDAQEF